MDSHDATCDQIQLFPDEVLLERFCGRERFAVSEVEVYFDTQNPDSDAPLLLNLEIHCKGVIECTVPEEELPLRDPAPTIELWLPVSGRTARDIANTKVAVARSHEPERDAWNRLYYCEHGDLWGIVASFASAEDGACRLRLVANACDVNHYSGDKPETIVRADVLVLLPG